MCRLKIEIESKCRGTASRTHCKVLHIISLVVVVVVIIIVIEKWHKNRDFQIEFNKYKNALFYMPYYYKKDTSHSLQNKHS